MKTKYRLNTQSVVGKFAAAITLIALFLLTFVAQFAVHADQSSSQVSPEVPVTMSSLDSYNAPPVSVSSPWSGSVSMLLMSKYYGSIYGGIFYDGPMSFTDFALSHQDRFGAFTVDLSIGQKLDRLDKYNRDGGNEYDLTLDHSFKLGSKAYPVLIDIGTCYLVVTDLGKAGDDVFEEFVRLDFPIKADRKNGPLFQPYVEAFHYHMVDGMQDKGWFLYGGVFRDQPLGCRLFGKELVLNIDYRIGATLGAYCDKDELEYHRLALSLPLACGKWTITPSIIGQIRGGKDRVYASSNEFAKEFFATIAFKRSF